MTSSPSTGADRTRGAPTHRRAELTTALFSVIALVAVACGGGGSSSPAASRAPTGSTGTGGSSAIASSGIGSVSSTGTGGSSAISSTGTGGSSAISSTGTGGSGAISSTGTQSAQPSASGPGGSAAVTPVPSAPQPSPKPLATGGPTIATTLQPPSGGATANINIWTHFTGPDGEYFAGLVQKFNSSQQACNASMRVQLGSVFNQQVVSAAVGNELPEILVGGEDRIAFLASEGVLRDVSDVATQAGFGPDKFPAATWNLGIYNGTRYAIPFDVHPAVFYYNKGLFQQAGLDPSKPPADKAAFEAAIQAIQSKTDADGYEMVGSGPGAIFLVGLQFATLFYQGGGQWTNADYTQATFNSPQGVQAATYLRHLVADLNVPLVESDKEIAAFAAGTNAMVLSGNWEASRYATALGDKLGIGPFPNIFGQGQWAGSHQMMLTTAYDKGSPEVQQCSAYFLDWLSANSYNWAEAGHVPARNEVRQAILNADPATLPQTIQIVQQIAPLADLGRFMPTIPSGGDLLFLPQGSGEAAVLAVNGTKPPQQALDDAATFFTQRLQQDKQNYGY